MTENKFKVLDELDIDRNIWDRIKTPSDTPTEETKGLYRRKEEQLNRNNFLVAWRWSGCDSNQKSMKDKRKAERLYNELTIDGWPSAA